VLWLWHDADGRVVEGAAEPVLTLTQCIFNQLNFGEVPDDSGELLVLNQAELADGQVQRQGGAVLSATDRFLSDAGGVVPDRADP
jgi:hypothetical protein